MTIVVVNNVMMLKLFLCSSEFLPPLISSNSRIWSFSCLWTFSRILLLFLLYDDDDGDVLILDTLLWYFEAICVITRSKNKNVRLLLMIKKDERWNVNEEKNINSINKLIYELSRSFFFFEFCFKRFSNFEHFTREQERNTLKNNISIFRKDIESIMKK